MRRHCLPIGIAITALFTPAVAGAGPVRPQTANTDGAIASLQRSAEQGDIVAQRRLGIAYEYGRGVGEDKQLAETWYRRSAEAGDLEAQSRYGRLLFKHDQSAALPWLRKAADRGEAAAAYTAGIALFNGDGADKNWPLAYAYLNIAADAGLSAASTSLAQMISYLSPAQLEQGKSRLVALQSRQLTGRTVEAVSPRPLAKREAPSSAVSARTATRPPTGGSYYVQLGAYSSQPLARSAWARIGASLGGVIGDRGPAFINAGSVVRLRLNDLDRAHAEQLCRTAQSHQFACFVGLRVGDGAR